VINLEHAADIIANNLMEFVAKRTRRGSSFAPEELDLIAAMHAELADSLRLGLSVFLHGSGGLGDARRLVARKRQLRRLEAEAPALSLRTLHGGADGPSGVTTRVDNSDFLRIIRDLRRVHSHIAALSYPVLERAGENSNSDSEEGRQQLTTVRVR
jgi:phosphate:Na+ symporter